MTAPLVALPAIHEVFSGFRDREHSSPRDRVWRPADQPPRPGETVQDLPSLLSTHRTFSKDTDSAVEDSSKSAFDLSSTAYRGHAASGRPEQSARSSHPDYWLSEPNSNSLATDPYPNQLVYLPSAQKFLPGGIFPPLEYGAAQPTPAEPDRDSHLQQPPHLLPDQRTLPEHSFQYNNAWPQTHYRPVVGAENQLASVPELGRQLAAEIHQLANSVENMLYNSPTQLGGQFNSEDLPSALNKAVAQSNGITWRLSDLCDRTQQQRNTGQGSSAGRAHEGGDSVNLQGKKRRRRTPPPNHCRNCNVIDTPEWRRGPDGARTLCNACGLVYAKLERKRQQETCSLPTTSLPDNETV